MGNEQSADVRSDGHGIRHARTSVRSNAFAARSVKRRRWAASAGRLRSRSTVSIAVAVARWPGSTPSVRALAVRLSTRLAFAECAKVAGACTGLDRARLDVRRRADGVADGWLQYLLAIGTEKRNIVLVGFGEWRRRCVGRRWLSPARGAVHGAARIGAERFVPLGVWQSMVVDARGGASRCATAAREAIAMEMAVEHESRRLARTNEWRTQFP